MRRVFAFSFLLLGAGCAAATAPAAPPPATADLPIRLVGTEPFWGGRIEAQTLTLEKADGPGFRGPLIKTRAIREVGLYEAVQRRPDGQGTVASVQLRAETCSDGMSDRLYPMSAVVIVGGGGWPVETLKGCAIPQRLFETGR
jgi:uncharacterized membrane protein